MSEKKQVVFIGYVWPESNTTAAGQNILSYMRTFTKEGWQVTFLCAAQTTPYSDDLQAIGIKTKTIELNNDSFNVLIKQISPDVVIFDRFLSEEQFAWRVAESCPTAIRILDSEDLHFLRYARHKLLSQISPDTFQSSEDILKPEFLHFLHSDKAFREIASIFRCDLSFVVSKFESKLLQEHFNLPKRQVAHLPFIRPNSTSTEKPFDERKHLISIGNLQHLPNVLSTELIIDKVMPVLRQKIPDIEFHIYGAYAPHRISQRVNAKKGIYLKGFVENHLQTIEQYKLLLAPLQFGAGIKGKLIDAMETKTPSITTPIGAEGITENNWPGEICGDIDSFIDACLKLYMDEKAWLAASNLSQAALSTFGASLHNETVLLNAIEDKLNQRESSRKNNFFQAMLSHQSFHAAKYMGQWISEKNKHK